MWTRTVGHYCEPESPAIGGGDSPLTLGTRQRVCNLDWKYVGSEEFVKTLSGLVT